MAQAGGRCARAPSVCVCVCVCATRATPASIHTHTRADACTPAGPCGTTHIPLGGRCGRRARSAVPFQHPCGSGHPPPPCVCVMQAAASWGWRLTPVLCQCKPIPSTATLHSCLGTRCEAGTAKHRAGGRRLTNDATRHAACPHPALATPPAGWVQQGLCACPHAMAMPTTPALPPHRVTLKEHGV